jgi:hypothetical protein
MAIGGGGEWEFISISPLPSIFKNALIPFLWVDRPTLIIYFFVLTYFPMLELTKMNQGHSLPPPPQMRNGGSLPAYLPLPLRIPTNPSGWL